MCNNPTAPMPSSPHQSESWFPNSHPAQSRSTLTETPLTNSTPFTMNPSSLTALPNTKSLGRAGSAQTQRSLEHVGIGRDLIPRQRSGAYAILKKAAANANHADKRLDDEKLR